MDGKSPFIIGFEKAFCWAATGSCGGGGTGGELPKSVLSVRSSDFQLCSADGARFGSLAAAAPAIARLIMRTMAGAMHMGMADGVSSIRLLICVSDCTLAPCCSLAT